MSKDKSIAPVMIIFVLFCLLLFSIPSVGSADNNGPIPSHEEEMTDEEKTERGELFDSLISTFLDSEVFKAYKCLSYNSSPTKNGLKGLTEISIDFEKFGDTSKETGITEELIKTQAELYFRKNELLKIDDNASSHCLLMITVTTMSPTLESGIPIDAEPIICSLKIQLYQPIFLQRLSWGDNLEFARALHCMGITWQDGRILAAPRWEIKDFLLRALKECLDKFSNDFMKENPKAKWGGNEKPLPD